MMDTSSKHLADLFLSGTSLAYLAGFASMYTQIEGLQGPRGIIPLNTLPKESLTWFLRPFCRPDIGVDVICISGMLCAAAGVLSRRGRNAFNMASLWWLYTSLKPDDPPMLQDVGFVAAVTAASNRFGLTLSRWLLFSAMFQSGVGKMLGGCKQWWDLTALQYHYQSQPLPTSLGWFMAQLPPEFHKVCVALSLVVEGIVPLLFLDPLRKLASMRWAAFGSQIALQLAIGTSGNFGFFNFLTATTCLPLLETSPRSSLSPPSQRAEAAAVAALCTSIVAATAALMRGWVRYGHVETYSAAAANMAMGVGGVQMLASFAATVQRVLAMGGKSGGMGELVGALCGLAFWGASLPSLTNVLQYLVLQHKCSLVKGQGKGQKQGQGRTMEPAGARAQHLAGFFALQGMLGKGYAMFVRLTGVPTRPELVLEAATDLTGPFVEVPFRYKPALLDRRPQFVAPHHPVLDYQLWLCTNACIHEGCPFPPWFFSFLRRLLQGGPEVEYLLDRHEYRRRFPRGRTPRFVRVKVYQYHFRRWSLLCGARASKAESASACAAGASKESSEWWQRDGMVLHATIGADQLGLGPDMQPRPQPNPQPNPQLNPQPPSQAQGQKGEEWAEEWLQQQVQEGKGEQEGELTQSPVPTESAPASPALLAEAEAAVEAPPSRQRKSRWGPPLPAPDDPAAAAAPATSTTASTTATATAAAAAPPAAPSAGLEAGLERTVLWLRECARPCFGDAAFTQASAGIVLVLRLVLEYCA